MRNRAALAVGVFILASGSAFAQTPTPGGGKDTIQFLYEMILSLQARVDLAGMCPADSVRSGPVCVDKYENSVWDLSAVSTGATKAKLVASIHAGNATLASLTSAGGVQRGLFPGDLAANGCPETGNGCVDVYAVSLPGVTPSAFINWFQAATAARNAGKRLPTNQEWQMAALGTPDPGADDSTTTCATASPLGATGSRNGCISDVGAFDMVGNLQEWVADWVPRATPAPPAPLGCAPTPGYNSWGAFSDDLQCLVGAATTGEPGALIRGGSFISGAAAGVFYVTAGGGPTEPAGTWGFRSAR
jgi:hypothetical protein